MRKIKKYYVNPEDSAVLAMSVVDEPAVESEFIYLSKQQKVDKFVALETNEKHMIYGCALRPDFPIYRNDSTEEYYLEFSKEAVEKLARNFMVNGFQQNFTQAHKSEVEGITVTESWIKVDMEKDKSVALGLDADLPVGSWLIGAYCNNADVWDKVKAGTYHGFSCEAIVDVNELQFEEQTPDVAPTVTETVETPVVEEPAPVVEEPTPVVEDTKPTIEDRLDKIWEVVQTMLPKEEPKAEEVDNEPEPQVEEKPAEEVKSQEGTGPNPLEEVVNNLKAEIEALKANNTSLLEQIRELGAKPSAKPISTNPSGEGNGGVSNLSSWLDKMQDMMR